MTLPYKNFGELSERYQGSIIYYGAEPVFVQDILEDHPVNGLNVWNIGDKAMKRRVVKASEVELIDHAFNLGYINKLPHDDGDYDEDRDYLTSYCYRTPKRQWKQGLNEYNIDFEPLLKSFHELTTNPMFRDMLMNKYPTLKQAKKLLKLPIREVAFNQKLALVLNRADQVYLEYRGTTIGVSEDGDKFKLRPSHTYMREFVEAKGIEVW